MVIKNEHNDNREETKMALDNLVLLLHNFEEIQN